MKLKSNKMILTHGYKSGFPNLLFTEKLSDSTVFFAAQYSFLTDVIGSGDSILIIPIPGKIKSVSVTNHNYLKCMALATINGTKIHGIMGEHFRNKSNYSDLMHKTFNTASSYEKMIDTSYITVCNSVSDTYNFLLSNWDDVFISSENQSMLFNGLSLLFSKSDKWSFILLRADCKEMQINNYTPVIEVMYTPTFDFKDGLHNSLLYFPTLNNCTNQSFNLFTGKPQLDKTTNGFNDLVFLSSDLSNSNSVVLDLSKLKGDPIDSIWPDIITSNYFKSHDGNTFNGDVLAAKGPKNNFIQIYLKHLIN